MTGPRTLAELDRLATPLHARVVTKEAMTTMTRLAYEKGLADATTARAALPPSAPPTLPTRCALCGGPHLSADAHTYEELLSWENDRAARQRRAERVDAHKDHDTDGPADEASGFPTCSGCGAILTDLPSAPPALDVGLSKRMDQWAARLDARFKRALSGEGCWNCGCPDAQYVRRLTEEQDR